LGAHDQLVSLIEEPAVREQVTAIPDLEELLSDHLADAAAAWPGVVLAEDAYLRHVARTLTARSGEAAERVLRTLPAADLYLAAACAIGDERALEIFRKTLLPPIRDVLARFGVTTATIDDALQNVLEMLFVGAGRPQILTYSGRGRLHSWLRTVGVRTGRRLMGKQAVGDDDALDDIPGAVDDPRLEFLRAEYADAFRAAFLGSLGDLTDRQRNLLRQYHLDELTIDQLATLYRINRATAARWVIAARAALLEGTRRRLAETLAIPATEVDSIIRLVRSRIDVSIREILVR
jgi:RNA polymerase sigma-70 factor (ECF subfamily)